jgi:DNA-binding NarL/FixJ family response regulator
MIARCNVLIVDDQSGFRWSLCRLLEADGFSVVGEAGSGVEALAEVGALRPELVLLDVLPPDRGGFTVAERLARLPDRPHVVLISSRAAEDLAGRLAVTSAEGFLAKRERLFVLSSRWRERGSNLGSVAVAGHRAGCVWAS